MSKLLISLDGVVIREVPITKEKTTIGRRPYNDVVIDNLAVSGEHAMVRASEDGVVLQDLDSTNGTYIQGRPVTTQALADGDVIEIGKYRVRFVATDGTSCGPPRAGDTSGPVTAPAAGLSAGVACAPGAAGSIRVLDGPAAGRAMALVKDRTPLGMPGVQVAAIERRDAGYRLTHIEGVQRPSVNGIPTPEEGMALHDGDMIELAGTRMQFVSG